MSNTNQATFAYLAETTFGVTPAGTGTYLRVTSDSVEAKQALAKSNEIVATRETSSLQRVGLNTEGSLGVELPYGAHDDLLQWALFSAAWTGNVTVGPATTISAANADNSLNDSGSGFGSLVVGQWAKATGFTGNNAVNNGKPFKIVTKTTSKITVSGITIIDDAAGESVTIKQGAYIVNGTTAKSFTLQKQFTDLTNEFMIALGQMIRGASLSIGVGNLITGSFELVGKSMDSGTATVMGTPSAAPTTDPANGVDNIVAVYIGGYAVANVVSVRNIALTIANNLRMREVCGTLGPESIGAGDFDLTGTLQAYYSAASTFHTVFRANTYSSIAISVKDVDGNCYVIEIPSIKWEKVAILASGKNGDVMNDCSFTTRKDPTAGFTIRIYRIPA